MLTRKVLLCSLLPAFALGLFAAASACETNEVVSNNVADSATGASDVARGVDVDSPDASRGQVTVQVLAINDFHGNLEPPSGSGGVVVAKLADGILDGGLPDSGIVANLEAGTASIPAGGAAYLATLVKSLRAKNPYTVMVSAGDLTGASPLISNVFFDEPSVLVMNAMGLDYEGVGNHDFDRGLTELLRLAKGGPSPLDGGGVFPGARFQYLAANVNTAANRTIFPAYDIKEFGGAKVGIIGMTLEGTPSVTVASAISGLTFKNEVATANGLVQELRAKGADAIVVVLHQGGFQDPSGTYDTCSGLTGELSPILFGTDAGGANLSTEVDVLVSAHTHQPYNCEISRPGASPLLLTSAASFGRLVTKIDLVVDTASKKVVRKTATNIVVTRNVTPDPEVASIVADYKARSAALAARTIGYLAGPLVANAKTLGSASCETTMGDVIADAQLAATKAVGAVAAFMNPGGIRGDLVPQADRSVSYGMAFGIQPFANLLVTMDVSGDDILTLLKGQFASSSPRILQVSSNVQYTYVYDRATQKVVISNVRLGGQSLVATQTYRITVNSFLAGGGDNFAVLKSGTNRITGAVDLDALVEYFQQASGPTTALPVPLLTRISGNACQ
jgi:5'-nucleotidase